MQAIPAASVQSFFTEDVLPGLLLVSSVDKKTTKVQNMEPFHRLRHNLFGFPHLASVKTRYTHWPPSQIEGVGCAFLAPNTKRSLYQAKDAPL